MRTTTVALLFVVLSLSKTTAFQAGTTPRSRWASTTLLQMTPEEERALAMSNYLAKAHEEKLRAVQAAEDKHEKEISELKDEIKRLKEHASSSVQPSTSTTAMVSTAGTGTSAADLMALSKEELANRILSHQSYLSKYIVEAQEAKLLAVRQAVADTNKKWEEKGLQLAPATSADLAVDRKQQEDTLFDKRNAAVAAAGSKSRWGDLEVKRASTAAASTPPAAAINGAAPAPAPVAAAAKTPPPSPPPAPPAVEIVVPPEVVAADHGLRADGGVGGLTLAERVSMGANAATAAADATAAPLPPVLTKEQVLYEKRNSMVLAAAAVGKSRWGDQEIARVKDLGAASLPAASSKTISLEERVNLGARLLGQ